MKNYFKKMLSVVMVVILMTGFLPSALASSSAGQIIDYTNTKLDELLTDVFGNLFDLSSVTTSTEEFLGKAGTIYFNLDEQKVMCAGETTYRTYTFTDENFFILYVGGICTLLDMKDVLDYGVKVYMVQNNQTRLLTTEEISSISAQFAMLLN